MVNDLDYGVVYLITNKVNGKQYVGQTTVSIALRWRRHCWGCAPKSNMPISLAIKKYGKHNFTIELIESCASQESLDEAEIRHARRVGSFSPNGYNLKAGSGCGSMSEATKKKIGDAHRGRKLSDEHRRLLSESHKGLPMPETTRRKLSQLYRGRRLPEAAYRNGRIAIQKTYRLKDPTGNIVVVGNMREHCKKHGLSTSKMSMVVNGKSARHKGWTGSVLGERGQTFLQLAFHWECEE